MAYSQSFLLKSHRSERGARARFPQPPRPGRLTLCRAGYAERKTPKGTEFCPRYLLTRVFGLSGVKTGFVFLSPRGRPSQEIERNVSKETRLPAPIRSPHRRGLTECLFSDANRARQFSTRSVRFTDLRAGSEISAGGLPIRAARRTPSPPSRPVSDPLLPQPSVESPGTSCQPRESPYRTCFGTLKI